jgi:CheY-like chemotaxis protein
MPPTVLIADDEMHIRLLIEQTLEELEDEGVEFLSVSNGEEALATARSVHPTILLLDVMMPGLNGFEVCRELRSDPALSKIHIILLTAKGQEYDRRQGEAVGANRYITKPFNPDDLLEIVRSTLQADQGD